MTQTSTARHSDVVIAKRAQRHSRTSLKLVTPDGKAALYDRILEGFGKAGTIKGAARYAGIAHTTLRDWYRRDPLLRERLEDADDDVTDDLYATAVQRALAGSDRLIIFLLNARGRGLEGRKKPPPPTGPELIQQISQMVQAQPTLGPLVRSRLQGLLAALA